MVQKYDYFLTLQNDLKEISGGNISLSVEKRGQALFVALSMHK